MTRSAILLTLAALVPVLGCRQALPPERTFPNAHAAVQALIDATQAGNLDELIAIFGPEGRDLLSSSDQASARRNREIFVAAVAEQWHLEDAGGTSKTLVIGNEQWPFPVPLVTDGKVWHFDTAAGKEEVIARRIGRNELAAIRICRTYVAAQQLYAAHGHDGQPAGAYARAFRSEPGRQNGLYWQASRGQKPSPLGDLVAAAAQEGQKVGGTGSQPSPFHGYYFRILTAQGAAASGGAKDYVSGGRMSGGFALVAWPAQYDATGVMTFVVNHEGIVREKDFGVETDSAARAMTLYNPDASWAAVR